MRNVSASYKAYQLVNPAALAAGTTTPAAVAISPGEEQDGMAIVSVGNVVGAPTSTTVTVTISASATLGGSYTTLNTFPVATSGNQIGTQRVLVNTGLYSYIKCSVVVGFTGGTTPSVAVGVVLIQRQTIGTDNNMSTLA